eukprot:1517478-Rhodomonas_salina.1
MMIGHSEHAGAQEAGCGALGSLADNAYNQVKIAGEGGIARVSKAMRKPAKHAGMQKAGASAAAALQRKRGVTAETRISIKRYDPFDCGNEWPLPAPRKVPCFKLCYLAYRPTPQQLQVSVPVCAWP